MQTVVLAAGAGTRMGPLTDETPKPMLPVGDRPLLDRILEAAATAGASEFVIVVGYRGDRIRSAFGDHAFGAPITYVEQDPPRGTADAVRAAADRIEGSFVVLNGDNWYAPEDLRHLYEAGPAVGVTPVEQPRQYGVVSLDGETVTDIIEKPIDPPSSVANTGAYRLPESVLDHLDVDPSERGEFELPAVLERVIDRRDVRAVEFDRWLDVGHPWDLLQANELALADLDRSIEGSVHETATLRGPVAVRPGASVDAGAVLEGPVLVRAGATVGPNSYVRGRTVIGPDARLGGQSVEVKNSVIRAGTNVAHLAYVGDSVIGRDCNFGAGTTVANLRHDERSVEVAIGDDPVSTGRRKFGVVTGDGVKTGIDTSIDAGVVLESGARTDPGAVVTADR